MQNDNRLEIADDEITITSTSGILRNKTRTFDFHVEAPKETFLLSDALSKHGAFPCVNSFIEAELRTLFKDYLRRARGIIAKASELSKPKQSNK